MNSSPFWGHHGLMDAKAGNMQAITNPEHIKEFSRVLIEKIDMQAYGEPQVVHFGEGDLAGYTLVSLIHTSCISAHFNDCSGDFYLDIFSCKPFDINVAENVVREFFNPQQIRVNFLTRQA
jgi:S-adenosylmethionine/arginine decarboxylase-like enzyme